MPKSIKCFNVVIKKKTVKTHILIIITELFRGLKGGGKPPNQPPLNPGLHKAVVYQEITDYSEIEFVSEIQQKLSF